jgi:acetyl-CoA acetyltransferase
MRDVYVIGAARTAIGKLGGALAGMTAVELGRAAVVRLFAAPG